jgi:hypothetical protein
MKKRRISHLSYSAPFTQRLERGLEDGYASMSG